MMENKNDELLHYGVPGMKWGRRRNTVPLINKNLRKQNRMSAGERKVAETKAAYKTANKQYNKDYNKAYNYSSTHMIRQYLGGKSQKTSDANWETAYKSAKAADKAKSAYKKAKTDLKRSNVKAYKESDKRANKLYADADKEMAKAKELYKNTGKNAISRVINNMKGKSEAVKEYSKQFDKADKIYNKADQEWMKSQELYKKTGKSRLTRYLNTRKYN